MGLFARCHAVHPVLCWSVVWQHNTIRCKTIGKRICRGVIYRSPAGSRLKFIAVPSRLLSNTIWYGMPGRNEHFQTTGCFKLGPNCTWPAPLSDMSQYPMLWCGPLQAFVDMCLPVGKVAQEVGGLWPLTRGVSIMLVSHVWVTMLSKWQYKGIMAPIMTVGLNGLGSNWPLPQTLVHGTIEKQGLGLPHIYTLQGISHLEDVITHPALESLTSRMHGANLEQLLVDIGLGTNRLLAPFKKFGYLTPSTWMSCLWQLLDESNLQLKHNITASLQWQGDQYLIPTFQKHCPESQLRAVNQWHLYLQEMTVADTSSADRLYILEAALKGEKDPQRPHYYVWSTQHSPCETNLKWWWYATTSCFTSFGNEQRQPLGQWKDKASGWILFHCLNEEHLYQWTGNG